MPNTNMAKLVHLWRRRAKADTDPANGSAIQQAQGRAFALCADELEKALHEKEPTDA